MTPRWSPQLQLLAAATLIVATPRSPWDKTRPRKMSFSFLKTMDVRTTTPLEHGAPGADAADAAAENELGMRCSDVFRIFRRYIARPIPH